MSEIIDLDALTPQPAIIMFEKQEITVQPPIFADYLILGDIQHDLEAADNNDRELVTSIEERFKQFFYRVIPELAGKPLHKTQILTLTNVFVNMAVPPQVKRLADQGVTQDSSKKEP